MRAAVSRSQNNVVQYCAFGALACAANECAASVSEARELALRAEAAVVNANRWPPGTRISQFNDSNTHEDVIAALRCAAQSWTVFSQPPGQAGLSILIFRPL